jgi:hypothetical protein
MTEMEQVIEQMRAMQEQSLQFAAQLQIVQAQNLEMAGRAVTREQEFAQYQATVQHGGGGASLAHKWAPADFTGEHGLWRDWCIKFRSYMGAQMRGEISRWLEHVDDHRQTSAKVAVLGEASRASASMMHGALIATCQGKALVIVQRAGPGEGLEAWRDLLSKYEPRSKQSKVMRLCEVLGFNFKEGDLLDCLERFEAAIAEYEKESGKILDDDIKIGVVIRGISTGGLREHLLLHSERTETFVEFRAELDMIARAQTASMMTASPMEIGAFGQGADGKFDGACRNCGKNGHKAADCRSQGKGGGGKKGGGKGGKGKASGGAASSSAAGCFACGVAGHYVAECKASPDKVMKHQATKTGSRPRAFKELSEETAEDQWASGAAEEAVGDIGGFDFCQLCAVSGEGGLPELLLRQDGSEREIAFTVDSAACRTVVPLDHPAARGYKVHRDGGTGQAYGTAKKGGPKIIDMGQRVLQTKVVGSEAPKRLHTRKADVQKPLLAVCDLVDRGHSVLFDSTGSYAMNKRTGEKTPFARVGKDWILRLTLEAPQKANIVMAQAMAEMRELKTSAAVPVAVVERAEPLFRLAVQ